MAYTTYDFYTNSFIGESVSEADFPALLGRASEIVEEMCGYKITESNMDKYGVEMQNRIQRAVCAQIEYLDANGGSELDTAGGLSSASVGKFSYSTGNGSSGSDASQSIYAPRAVRILAPTGLLYRGGVCL